MPFRIEVLSNLYYTYHAKRCQHFFVAKFTYLHRLMLFILLFFKNFVKEINYFFIFQRVSIFFRLPVLCLLICGFNLMRYLTFVIGFKIPQFNRNVKKNVMVVSNWRSAISSQFSVARIRVFSGLAVFLSGNCAYKKLIFLTQIVRFRPYRLCFAESEINFDFFARCVKIAL